MIEAKVIADSVAPSGVRLTTLELKYPRFIHAEFMTHRVFSRNASSSRAIPVQRMIEQVRNNPATPIHWGKNQPGMQAREELSDKTKVHVERHWRDAAANAAYRADMLNWYGLHKQITNRILEPFQHITVVVTATEWDNFFELRDHEDAQPEIAVLAKAMRRAMEESVPRLLKPGEWHTPYSLANEYVQGDFTSELAIKTSVAGCARVSYNTHDGSNRTVAGDTDLYDKLLASRHMSPFEHQATPMESDVVYYKGELLHSYAWGEGVTHVDRNMEAWSGNFRNWIQNRQIV